jgi:hypothetical protein
MVTDYERSIVLYNYGKLTWTSSVSSGGENGLGGIAAQVIILNLMRHFLSVMLDEFDGKHLVLFTVEMHLDTCQPTVAVKAVRAKDVVL